MQEYPEIGKRVKCLVVKSSFIQATLKIVEVEGKPAKTDYKAILKANTIGEDSYLCDKLKQGEYIDCVVVSCGDTAVFVTRV